MCTGYTTGTSSAVQKQRGGLGFQVDGGSHVATAKAQLFHTSEGIPSHFLGVGGVEYIGDEGCIVEEGGALITVVGFFPPHQVVVLTTTIIVKMMNMIIMSTGGSSGRIARWGHRRYHLLADRRYRRKRAGRDRRPPLSGVSPLLLSHRLGPTTGRARSVQYCTLVLSCGGLPS